MDEATQRFTEGVIHYEKGDYLLAITAFDKSIAIDPTKAEVWHNRGLSLIQTGQFQEALLSINKALVLNPRYENAKKSRKIILDLLKDSQITHNTEHSASVPTAHAPSKIIVITIAVIVIIGAVAGLMVIKNQQNNADTSSSGSARSTLVVPATTQLPVLGPGDIPYGKGQFVFNDTQGNADRPITVYTYRPASWNQSGPILIVMPGAGRDGESPRDTWIPYAEQYSALVVVPEFSQEYYPGDNWYPLGNIYNYPNWIPQANWTYMVVEHLFDYVREKTGATQNTYLLDGHSAGAQFVHRLVTFLPDARYSRAVAANAGVYVMPVYTIPYNLGLKDSPLPESDLPKVFSRKLIIMSGGSDTNPNDPSLANFPAAEAQGSTRFARAKNYFTTAQEEAAQLGVPLNWEYHVVPGIGHDEAGMAGPSAEMLFNES